MATEKYMSDSLRLLTQVYESAGTVVSGKGRFTTVNELTDQVPAARPQVLVAAVYVLKNIAPLDTRINKALSEEDKGAILAGMFSTQMGLRLAMARHNVPYDIPGSIQVPLDMEYMTGRLTVNGLEKHDNLVIIDDTLASGGTLVSLINAAREAGCRILDVRVVVEKLGYGGREALQEIGVKVSAGIGIEVSSSGRIFVKEHLECPV